MTTPNRTTWPLPILTALLLVATQLRVGVELFAWVLYVPLFVHLRSTRGAGPFLYAVGVVFIGWSIALIKIITPPLPLYFIFIYAIPITGLHALGFLLVRLARSNRHWWVVSAGAFAVTEWLLGALTPFGTWGSIAYTRVNDLALLQLGSIAGMSGVAFLILLVNALLAELVARRWFDGESWAHLFSRLRAPLIAVGAVLVAVYTFGWLRLSIYETRDKPTVAVATVDHDEAGFAFTGEELAERAAEVQEVTLELTRRAAEAGAIAVGWMEGGVASRAEEEEAWQARLSSTARELGIHIAAAYIVPLNEAGTLLANKIVWVRPDGQIDHEYEKNVPVPSEPVRKGELPPQLVAAANSAELSFSAAICYDYDFPRIANHIGRLGADIVMLPSGDWRGIDPLHTQMSAFRAIENGHTIVRPTNAGLSAVVSPVGRILGWRSDWDTGAGVLVVQAPAQKLFTLYTVLGEWVILLPALLALGFWLAGRRKNNAS